MEITIISRIENDYQAWTFCIEEKDMEYLYEKYGDVGCSVRGSAEDVVEEILETYR